MKELDVPEGLKSKEVQTVVWCGDHEGDFRIVPASTTNVEVVNWTVEGTEVTEKLKEKCTGFKHIFARVNAVRKCTKILVPASGRPKDYRIIDYTLVMKEVIWTKNPDEWFIATQATETQAIKACNLIVARELAKSLDALKEAQKLAEEIEYGISPFQPYGSDRVAWADMIDGLEMVQKAEVTFRAEPGGFEEISALLRFYYEWGQTFQRQHIRKLGFQTMDIIDGLLKTAKYYASVARQRLVTKLSKGMLKVGAEETQRAAKEWELGWISTFAYTLYEARKFAAAYEMIRDAIMLKESPDLDPKEDMLEDLLKWAAEEPEFLAALPEDQLRRFPGQVESMIHKLSESENLDNLKGDAVRSLRALKEKQANTAWDPPIDPVIENLKKGLPADVKDPHAGHGS